MSGWLLGLVLATGTADDAAHDVEAFLKRGQAERAVQRAEASLPAVAPATRPQMDVLLGLARFELMDFAGSREAFREALKLRPDVQLPDWANPRALDAFATERALLRAPPSSPRASTNESSSPAASSSASSPLPSPRQSALRQRVGLCLAGAGMAAVAGGVLFGVRSASGRSNAVREPDAQRARQQLSTASAEARTANILFVVGGGVAVVGLGLAAVPGENGMWFSLAGTW